MMDPSVAASLLKLLSALDPRTLASLILLAFATPVGTMIVILVLWWTNERRRAVMLETYRADMQRILDAYGADIRTVTQFYKDNVELVRCYQSIAEDLKSVVVLNTQTITRLCDRVEMNQFCPIARKEARG